MESSFPNLSAISLYISSSVSLAEILECNMAMRNLGKISVHSNKVKKVIIQ
ncbi:MAG: hypothetical protein QM493_07700 [Sulfurovum sp.]